MKCPNFVSHRVVTIVDAAKQPIRVECDRCHLVDPPAGSECSVPLRRHLDQVTGRLHAARESVRRVAVWYCDCPIGQARASHGLLVPDFGCEIGRASCRERV